MNKYPAGRDAPGPTRHSATRFHSESARFESAR